MATASAEAPGSDAGRLAREFRAVLGDGTVINLPGADQKRLEIAFVRRTAPGN
jgi:hypothetical protein